jgi:hypothetical protein
MTLTIEIASLPDRSGIVAEIWSGDEMVAEMRMIEARFGLEIYPSQSREPWSFDLQEWFAALNEARKRLA